MRCSSVMTEPQRHATCSCKHSQAHTLPLVARRLPFHQKEQLPRLLFFCIRLSKTYTTGRVSF
nr:MAG TPA: hypothetical protein [Caudoviricetes sp.]